MSSDSWMAWAMEHYNTDEAGVKKIMTERAKLGPKVREARLRAQGKKHRGGFSDPEFARKAGALGKAKRFGKSENQISG